MGWISARRKNVVAKLEEERSFIDNGSRLMEAMIKLCDGKHIPIRFFSKFELEKATDNYNKDGIFHQQGSYDLYKGWYNNKNISVMKFNDNFGINRNKIVIASQMSTNEIVIASQMSSHKNILRLLGCCLETEIPVLVYEYAINGNLEDYILGKEIQVLSWESRLRIAMEIGYAISYLHMSKSSPIIHRDIKPSNILLDQNYVAKLVDFTLSLSIPMGKTYVDDVIAGTLGYVDPECFGSGRFTTKSDVYGFGVVLLEMTTGKPIMDIDNEISEQMISGRDEEIDNIALMCQVREEWFNGSKLIQGNVEQLMACSELAFRCLKENSAERPEMKEVVEELRRIEKGQPTSLVQSDDEELSLIS